MIEFRRKFLFFIILFTFCLSCVKIIIAWIYDYFYFLLHLITSAIKKSPYIFKGPFKLISILTTAGSKMPNIKRIKEPLAAGINMAAAESDVIKRI